MTTRTDPRFSLSAHPLVQRRIVRLSKSQAPTRRARQDVRHRGMTAVIMIWDLQAGHGVAGVSVAAMKLKAAGMTVLQ